MRGTKYGFIRSISRNVQGVNAKSQTSEGKIRGRHGAVTVRGELKTDKQRKFHRFADMLAKATGVDIVLYDHEHAGEYEKVRGVHRSFADGRSEIWINMEGRGSRKGELMLVTMAHELTHFLAVNAKREFEIYRKFLFDQFGERADKLLADKIANGTKEPIAVEEVVAELSEDMLNDGSAIKKLAETDLTTVQKIKKWIDEFLQKLLDAFDGYHGRHYELIQEAKVDIEAMQKLFNDALAAATENYNAEQSQGTGKTEKADAERYSIAYTVDNAPVVVVQDNILDGVPKSQWIKTVKDTIRNRFTSGIPISGRLIKVNKTTVDEYTNSKITQAYKRSSRVLYKDKLRAANNLDEIVLASTNYINEDLKHTRKDNFKEFARGDVLLRIGGNDYSAKVIIGFTSGGNMVLYDVIDFMPDNFSIKKMGTHTVQSQEVKNGSKGVPINDNVPQNGTVVNSNSTQVDEKYSSIDTENGLKDIYDDIYYPRNRREQAAFNRSMANKTSDLQPGQKKNIIIYTADHAYFVEASGYMTGNIDDVVRITENEELLNRRIRAYGTDIHTDGKNLANWAEDTRNGGGRGGWSSSVFKDGGEDEAVDQLDAGSPENEQAGSDGSGADDYPRIEHYSTAVLSRREILDNREVDEKYSSIDEPYSYDALIAKPDMSVTSIDDTVQHQASKENRKQVVEDAVKNAAAVGYQDQQGNAFVHVADIDEDVMLPKDAFRHAFDRRFSFMAPFALEAGRILKNAIKVNELSVRTLNISNTYVLIGMAKDSKNIPYPVVFVVNKFSNEVQSIDVLYSLGAKKNQLTTNGPGFSPKIGVPLTGSTISISDLLEYVNAYFPDVLSESVLRHFGHTARPEGKIGQDALYSTAVLSRREILSDAFEELAENTKEAESLAQYREAITKIEQYEAELAEVKKQLKEKSFAPGKRDQAAIDELTAQKKALENKINRWDRKLLNVEAAQPLKDLFNRATAQASKKARFEGREALRESRDGRSKTALRGRIRKNLRELNKLLNRGTKEKNVKIELQDTVATALAAGDILFNDTISNEDIVRAGIQAVTDEERKQLKRYAFLLAENDSTEDTARIEKNKQQMYRLNKLLAGISEP